eukprot:6186087-Pleurochrysis_carterae.AAC.1
MKSALRPAGHTTSPSFRFPAHAWMHVSLVLTLYQLWPQQFQASIVPHALLHIFIVIVYCWQKELYQAQKECADLRSAFDEVERNAARDGKTQYIPVPAQTGSVHTEESNGACRGKVGAADSGAGAEAEGGAGAGSGGGDSYGGDKRAGVGDSAGRQGGRGDDEGVNEGGDDEGVRAGGGRGVEDEVGGEEGVEECGDEGDGDGDGGDSKGGRE